MAGSVELPRVEGQAREGLDAEAGARVISPDRDDSRPGTRSHLPPHDPEYP